MFSRKTILMAAALAVSSLMGAGAADAATCHKNWASDARGVPVSRQHVYDTLRYHHYRAFGAPLFHRGHYVVRSYNRFGRTVFVEIDPYTGAFIGEFRI